MSYLEPAPATQKAFLHTQSHSLATGLQTSLTDLQALELSNMD